MGSYLEKRIDEFLIIAKDRIAELEAEVERLRKAINMHHEPHCDNPMFGAPCTCWVREALDAGERD